MVEKAALMSNDASVTVAIYGTIAVVVATIVGPILAVQAQKFLERGRALEFRKTAIFRTLMIHRLALTTENVQAFNAVPVEFYGEEKILAAWRAYLAHMGIDATTTPSWATVRVDLFFDMLQKMAVHLGYDYNFVQLKNDFYSPMGHATVETDQETIRRGLADLFSGEKPLPLNVKSLPGDPETAALIKRWLKSQLPPETPSDRS